MWFRKNNSIKIICGPLSRVYYLKYGNIFTDEAEGGYSGSSIASGSKSNTGSDADFFSSFIGPGKSTSDASTPYLGHSTTLATSKEATSKESSSPKAGHTAPPVSRNQPKTSLESSPSSRTSPAVVDARGDIGNEPTVVKKPLSLKLGKRPARKSSNDAQKTTEKDVIEERLKREKAAEKELMDLLNAESKKTHTQSQAVKATSKVSDVEKLDTSEEKDKSQDNEMPKADTSQQKYTIESAASEVELSPNEIKARLNMSESTACLEVNESAWGNMDVSIVADDIDDMSKSGTEVSATEVEVQPQVMFTTEGSTESSRRDFSEPSQEQIDSENITDGQITGIEPQEIKTESVIKQELLPSVGSDESCLSSASQLNPDSAECPAGDNANNSATDVYKPTAVDTGANVVDSSGHNTEPCDIPEESASTDIVDTASSDYLNPVESQDIKPELSAMIREDTDESLETSVKESASMVTSSSTDTTVMDSSLMSQSNDTEVSSHSTDATASSDEALFPRERGESESTVIEATSAPASRSEDQQTDIAEEFEQVELDGSSSMSGSFVRSNLDEVLDADSHGDSQSHSSSDMVRVESSQNSGHTSADEFETTTSSDIEIISHISTPNGDGRLPYDLSPFKQVFPLSVGTRLKKKDFFLKLL